MDKILIKGMKVYAYHGVLSEEKALGQNFIFDIEMHLDLRNASKSDNLNDTVSYADVYDEVEAVVKGNKFDLLERLAGAVADKILENAMIKNVKVKIEKPGAPINGNFEYVGVEIYR